MVKHLRSFLVRWWELDEGRQRIELEHIQSGERTVVTSAAGAVAWIREYTGAAFSPPGSAVDATDERPIAERTDVKGGAIADQEG